MKPLPTAVGHSELIAEIMREFAFMACMSEPTDKSFAAMQEFDFNDLYKKSHDFFLEFTDDLGMIESDFVKVNCADELTKFLKHYASIVDVLAIQQNIHHNLNCK